METGKVHIVSIEVEGGAELLQEALRAFARVTYGALSEKPAVPAAVTPSAIAPPAQKKPRYAPGSRVRVRAEGTLSAAIRAAVREAPRTNTEILDAVKREGFPTTDSNSVSTLLCQFRKANEIYKDEDLKWHMAAGK